MLSAPTHEVRPFLSLLSSPRLHAASAPSRAFTRSYGIATGAMNPPEPSSFPEALIAPISTEDVAALPLPSTSMAQARAPSSAQVPGSRAERESRVRFGSTSVSIDNVSSMSAAKCEL